MAEKPVEIALADFQTITGQPKKQQKWKGLSFFNYKNKTNGGVI